MLAALAIFAAAVSPLFEELSRLDRQRWDGLTAAVGSSHAPLSAPADARGDEATTLLLMPRASVLTDHELRTGVLAHFLESPALRRSLTQHHITSVPVTFVFALWYLLQLNSRGQPHAEPLWQAWAEHHSAARTAEHALGRWSYAELTQLEEERLLEGALAYRRGVLDQYERLLLPIATNFTSFFPPSKIDLDAFARAIGVVSAHRVVIDGIDDEVLVPLPLRHHPRGNVSHQALDRCLGLLPMLGCTGLLSFMLACTATAETAVTPRASCAQARLEEVEQEVLTPRGVSYSRRMVRLVPSEDGATLPPSRELTLRSSRGNDDLLLEMGYLWDELPAALVPLRMWIDEQDSSLAARRSELLAEAKLNQTADFTLRHGGLDEDLQLWARIMHANASELDDAARMMDLGVPLCAATETAAYAGLTRSIESLLSRSEHGVDEDEVLLAASDKLGVRAALAVRHRRLSKMVLDDSLARLTAQLKQSEGARRRHQQQARPTGTAGVEASFASSSGSYSTARERKRADAAQRKKRDKKEEERRRRRERKAAGHAP